MQGKGSSFGGLVVIAPTPCPHLEISDLGVRLSNRGSGKKNFFVYRENTLQISVAQMRTFCFSKNH